MTENDSLSTTPAKEASEKFELRGRPPAPIRIKRNLIVIAAGIGASVLVGLAWFALEPTSFIAAESDEARTLSQAAPDAIAGLPKDYGGVPELGPPLPGDLGRPIMEARRRQEQVAPSPDLPPPYTHEQAPQQSRPVDSLQDQNAPLLVPIAKSDPTPAAAPIPPAQSTPAARLNAGTIIRASLVTGLASDVPGPVHALVIANVYDNATGRAVVIPQGARLIGEYDSRAAFGQDRLSLRWVSLIMPNGRSVLLDKLPATDVSGFAGVRDRTNNHTGKLIKGVLLSALLGVGSELSFGGSESELVRALRQSVQKDGSDAGEEIVKRYLDIPPSLTIRPGWPVLAVLTKDLDLPLWEG